MRKSKLNSAKWFVEALKQRQKTLQNTMNAIASALGCSVYDLLNDTGNTETQDDDPYILRDRLRRDPNYRMMFAAAENAKPEHIRAAAAMLKSLEGENND